LDEEVVGGRDQFSLGIKLVGVEISRAGSSLGSPSEHRANDKHGRGYACEESVDELTHGVEAVVSDHSAKNLHTSDRESGYGRDELDEEVGVEVGIHVSRLDTAIADHLGREDGEGHAISCRPAGAGVGVRESVDTEEEGKDSTENDVAERGSDVRPRKLL